MHIYFGTYFLISVWWKPWVHTRTSTSNPSLQNSFYTFVTFLWQWEETCHLLLMRFLLWSISKAALLPSSTHRCFLPAGTVTPCSGLPLAPCEHSLPCFRLIESTQGCPPHPAQAFNSPGLAAFTLTLWGHPPRPACALVAPLLGCLLTGLWHTVLGHQMCGWLLFCSAWLPCLGHHPDVLTILTAWVLTPHTGQPSQTDACLLSLGSESPDQVISWTEIPFELETVLPVICLQPIQALITHVGQCYSASSSCLAPAPCPSTPRLQPQFLAQMPLLVVST